ncbi:MAG TPA: plastocyanin/azurin family copper-binding protein [Nitrosopumilaceae archaeon]|nr:plastocyanin/azurin family copper-binding protein [Nitrosopumilaceae archaeon]
MKITMKVGVAFVVIVLGFVISPAIALNESEETRKSSTLMKSISQSSMTKTVMIIGNIDSVFVPQIIHINLNDSIKFINQDGQNGGVAHNVVSIDQITLEPNGNFNGYLQNAGDTFTVKFVEPGIYYYIDSIYPKILGTIVVG